MCVKDLQIPYKTLEVFWGVWGFWFFWFWFFSLEFTSFTALQNDDLLVPTTFLPTVEKIPVCIVTVFIVIYYRSQENL